MSDKYDNYDAAWERDMEVGVARAEIKKETGMEALTADRLRGIRMLERDYLERTIATVRNHRDADNCWPQWANIFADEIERCWAALEDGGHK